jgi:hypothetical protein
MDYTCLAMVAVFGKRRGRVGGIRVLARTGRSGVGGFVWGWGVDWLEEGGAEGRTGQGRE